MQIGSHSKRGNLALWDRIQRLSGAFCAIAATFLANVDLALASCDSGSRVEEFRFDSRVFKNSRPVRVYVPPGYADRENANRSYPLMFVTDGNMAFRTSIPNIVTVADRAITAGRWPAMIIVGPFNGAGTDKSTHAGRDRAREFLPWPDQGFGPDRWYVPDPPDPIGKLYPQFLLDELSLEVRSRFRVSVAREDTALVGFSYGGVAALYSALARPDQVGLLSVESTPLWMGANRDLLKWIELQSRWPNRLSIGAAARETEDQVVLSEGRKNLTMLADIARSRTTASSVQFLIHEDAKHDTRSWMDRLTQAIEFLFKGSKHMRCQSKSPDPGQIGQLDANVRGE
ncbi:MAG: alpha/beta hydrolase-fold protein [Burkholderiales bacterium]|nr:alpha/beta hydrolase-fold protein [Burkholderiales bacterium]